MEIPQWIKEPNAIEQMKETAAKLALVTNYPQEYAERSIMASLYPDIFTFDYDGGGMTIDEAIAYFTNKEHGNHD